MESNHTPSINSLSGPDTPASTMANEPTLPSDSFSRPDGGLVADNYSLDQELPVANLAALPIQTGVEKELPRLVRRSSSFLSLDVSAELESHVAFKALERNDCSAICDLLVSHQAILLLPISKTMIELEDVAVEFFGRHVYLINSTNPLQLLSISGMRGVMSRNRLYLIGPTPSEDELVRQWTIEADQTRAFKKGTLWDSFDMHDPSITQYPSVELYFENMIERKLEINGKMGSVKLLLIQRPIMEEDLHHDAWTDYSLETNNDSKNNPHGPAYHFLTTKAGGNSTGEETVALPAPANTSGSAYSLKPHHTPLAIGSPSQSGDEPLGKFGSTMFSFPSHVLDNINPLHIIPSLFGKTDIRLSELDIPSLKNDPSLLKFMELMADQRGTIILHQVYRFTTDLEIHFSTYPAAQVSAKTSLIRTSDRSDALSKRIVDFLELMQGFLHSTRLIRTQGEPYILTILDGMETYIIGKCFESVFGVSLMEEQINDYILASRLSILGISSFGLSDLGLDLYQDHHGFAKVMRAAGLELLRFERALSPILKMDALIKVHSHLVEFINTFTKDQLKQSDENSRIRNDESGANTDTLLGLLIYLIVQTHPTHLIASLRFTHKYRNPTRISGQESYCMVNIDAAVSFILTLDLTIIDIPEDLLESCSLPIQSTGKTIVLPADETKILHQEAMRPPTATPPNSLFQPGTAIISGINAVTDDIQKVTTRLSGLWFKRPFSASKLSSTSTSSPFSERLKPLPVPPKNAVVTTSLARSDLEKQNSAPAVSMHSFSLIEPKPHASNVESQVVIEHSVSSEDEADKLGATKNVGQAKFTDKFRETLRGKAS
ncbi:guanyl-nucleotide exchange factor activity protein [Batrachochytrium dendrobatidis]|nr:guanyl-nucleotide exchange factor [Batrachochytrium dendrobatidis]KAK5668382.1 guanyl-nucleotide exchange factor activity protein [Batrachochytrium dendrobatidis]